MYPAMKVRESVGRRCEACSETPEIRNPNKHTGFDKFKIGGLSIKLFIGVCLLYVLEGCAQNYLLEYVHYLYRRVVQKNYLSEYVPYMYRRIVHKIIYRSMSTIYIGGLSTSKTNIFVLESIFIHGTSMCERVGEDSRHEIGYVDIQVDTCMLHLDVCLIVRPCALRWGVALIGDYHYWALLTPSWDHISGAGQLPVDGAP